MAVCVHACVAHRLWLHGSARGCGRRVIVRLSNWEGGGASGWGCLPCHSSTSPLRHISTASNASPIVLRAPHACQVSAHGTGARIPPVDEQVVALKLVTPARGTIELSKVSGSGRRGHWGWGAGAAGGAGEGGAGRTAAPVSCSSAWLGVCVWGGGDYFKFMGFGEKSVFCAHRQ